MMEGCAPTLVRGTKKYEDFLVGESVEALPLHLVVDSSKLLIVRSALFAAASSFFLSFT